MAGDNIDELDEVIKFVQFTTIGTSGLGAILSIAAPITFGGSIALGSALGVGNLAANVIKAGGLKEVNLDIKSVSLSLSFFVGIPLAATVLAKVAKDFFR